MHKIIIKSILLALITSLVNVRLAFAYIDPNVGGALFQVLATSFALLTGIALLFSRQIRMGLAKVKRFLRERFNRNEEPETEAEAFGGSHTQE